MACCAGLRSPLVRSSWQSDDSHGRGHRFEPCTSHQYLLNYFNELKAPQGAFFRFQSSIKRPYYYSYVSTLVLLGLLVTDCGFGSPNVSKIFHMR